MSNNSTQSKWNFSFYKNMDSKQAHPQTNKSNTQPAPQQSFLDRVKSGTRGVFQGASETATATYNYAVYMPYIIALGAVGAFFLTIAFMFLPMALIAPQKFSFAFAIACGCFLGAIALLRGNPKAFFLSFLGAEKIKFTIAYAVAFVGTFYFSLVVKSTLMTFLTAFAQVVTSTWVIAISVPGGWKFVELCKVIFTKCFKTCMGMVASKTKTTLLGN